MAIGNVSNILHFYLKKMKPVAIVANIDFNFLFNLKAASETTRIKINDSQRRLLGFLHTLGQH
jgi:hypothetical protein